VHPEFASGYVNEPASQTKVVGVRMRNDEADYVGESDTRCSKCSLEIAKQIGIVVRRISGPTVDKGDTFIARKRIGINPVEARPGQREDHAEYSGSRLAAAMLDHRFS
jgi:hypothetical protein